MITRDEARAKTLKTVESRYSVQLKDLDNRINTAASQGLFETSVDGVIEDAVQSYLVDELGYSLYAKYKEQKSGREDSRNQTETVISWQNKTIPNI